MGLDREAQPPGQVAFHPEKWQDFIKPPEKYEGYSNRQKWRDFTIDFTNPKEGLTQPFYGQNGGFSYGKMEISPPSQEGKDGQLVWSLSGRLLRKPQILAFCTWTMRSSLEKLWEDDVLLGHGLVGFWGFWISQFHPMWPWWANGWHPSSPINR